MPPHTGECGRSAAVARGQYLLPTPRDQDAAELPLKEADAGIVKIKSETDSLASTPGDARNYDAQKNCTSTLRGFGCVANAKTVRRPTGEQAQPTGGGHGTRNQLGDSEAELQGKKITWYYSPFICCFSFVS